jgi:hypothetical protein
MIIVIGVGVANLIYIWLRKYKIIWSINKVVLTEILVSKNHINQNHLEFSHSSE